MTPPTSRSPRRVNTAAFASLLPIDGYDSAGHYEVFRYAPGRLPPMRLLRLHHGHPTKAMPPSLPTARACTDDGRVFFSTGEQLTLRDTNGKQDAYEWENGKQELISTGTSPSDSELLSVSSDGKDAFFFTRQKLVPEDDNGNDIRLYTAREGGGFAFGPPQFSCAASDECHGASTAPAPPLAAGTTAGTPGQFKPEEPRPSAAKARSGGKGKCVGRHRPQTPQPQTSRQDDAGRWQVSARVNMRIAANLVSATVLTDRCIGAAMRAPAAGASSRSNPSPRQALTPRPVGIPT